MKKILLMIIALLVFFIHSGCRNSEKSTSGNASQQYSLPEDTACAGKADPMKMLDSPTFNFGKIKAGDTVTHVFHFKNEGKEPLIIESATASCGCTIASYNKRPIAAGAVDSLVAVFTSHEMAPGFQNKVINIRNNVSASPRLFTLYGFVIKS